MANIVIKDDDFNERIELDDSGDILLKDRNGRIRIQIVPNGANFWLGGNGQAGDLYIFPSGATDINDASQAHIHLDGQNGNMILRSHDGNDRIHFIPNGANIWLGGNGQDGDLVLFPSDADDINDLSQSTIHLNGDSGDIILRNADTAENFDIAEAVRVKPGMVMTLNEIGKIIPSSTPYDKKVVGVVAGAGDHRPGIIMDNKGDSSKRIPVSVLGKVACKADATQAPIDVGDLLTTSQIVGHAMKATDQKKSFGSIIGKALSPLAEGLGFVDILVTLQ